VYQHLAHLPDLITPNLDVLFCGSNPGCQSAKISHYYGHRSNHFWKYLFRSGFTPYCLSPYDDHLLPSKFGLGLTDLVSRPTTEANELAPAERREAVPILLEKIRKFQPRFVCFVGIKQYEDLCIYLKKKRKSPKDKLVMSMKKTNIGLQEIVFKSHKIHLLNNNHNNQNKQAGKSTTNTPDWTYTFIFVCPSTSALVRNYEEKDRIGCLAELLELKNRVDLDELTVESDSSTGFDCIQLDDELVVNKGEQLQR